MLGISVSFYKKHFVFWVVVATLFFGLDKLNIVQTLADQRTLYQTVAETGYYNSTMEINQRGQVTVDGKKVRKVISPLQDSDILRVILFDKPDIYISYYRLVVTLPPNITEQDVKIIPRLVHTFDTGVSKSIINNQKITYSAQAVDQRATFSLEIEFPKGLLELPTSTLFYSDLNAQNIYWWIGFASVAPIISLAILSILLFRWRLLKKQMRKIKITSQLPAKLSPAIVEVLTTGRVSARALAATLLDLAGRGYLYIGLKDDNFIFGKHHSFSLPSQNVLNKIEDRFGNLDPVLYAISTIHDNTDLRIYERLLLSKLFTSENVFTDMEDFKSRVSHRLFSEKITRIYEEIYRLATSQGYFVEDPKTFHHRWKLSGLITFFGSIIGFAIGALYFPEPKTMLLFWVGMMLTALSIIKLSTRLPILSDRGIKAFSQWMSFRKFLCSPELMPFTDNSLQIFENYLPYAIVFAVENEWSARFRDHPFTQPNWFNSNSPHLSIEQFDSQLLPIVDWVAKTLTVSRTPTVD